MRAHRTTSVVTLLLGVLAFCWAVVQFGCAPYPAVEAENHPPVIESLTIENPPSSVRPTIVRQGETLEYVVSASDPDGDPLSFLWSASCGMMVSGAGERAMWRAMVPPGKSCVVTVVASDGKGGETAATDSIDVNAAPRRVSIVGLSEGVQYRAGMSVSIGADVLDGDRPADPYKCMWETEIGMIIPPSGDSGDSCGATYVAPSSLEAGDTDTIKLRIIENNGMDERPGDKYTATVTIKLYE